MQDRFKFRVWYKDLYSPEPKPHMIYGAERTYDCFCGDDEQIPASSFGVIIDDEEFIPMQCTGLKDKNGKLIYENDLILVNNIVYKVIYNKYKISLVNIKNNDIIDYDCNIICEVVGNEQEGYFGKI